MIIITIITTTIAIIIIIKIIITITIIIHDSLREMQGKKSVVLTLGSLVFHSCL